MQAGKFSTINKYAGDIKAMQVGIFQMSSMSKFAKVRVSVLPSMSVHLLFPHF